MVDLAAGEEIPVEILTALADENITKWAFNSNFERVCLSEWLRRNYPEYFDSYSVDGDTVGNYLNSRGWKCSMIWSAFMGLLLSLAGVGAVLGLEEQKYLLITGISTVHQLLRCLVCRWKSMVRMLI